MVAQASTESGRAGHAGIPTGVHVILERNGSILLMRRMGTGFFDGLYSLPGGHVEHGESMRQTAAREVREELGVTVRPEALALLGVVHRWSDTNRIEFVLRASEFDGTPVIAEPDKCDHLLWAAPDALPDGVVPYVLEVLNNRADSPWVLELGWA